METENKGGEVSMLTNNGGGESTNCESDQRRQSIQSIQGRRSARNSRVHFGDFEDFNSELFAAHDATKPLIVKFLKEEYHKTFTVSLGFLQEAHKYEVKFFVPIEEIRTYVLSRDEKLKVIEEPSSSSRLVKVSWVDDESSGFLLEIIMEVQVQEGINFDDKFVLSSDSMCNRLIHIKISAQVLGKGKGTPSLKYGIKCLTTSSSRVPPSVKPSHPE